MPTRVTETDFQTEDGRTVPFDKGKVPSVEHAVFDTEGLLEDGLRKKTVKVDVSFPISPNHAAHWRGLVDPLVDRLRNLGVTVNVGTHPDTGHPQDTLVFVSLWMSSHAPGKATRDGLGATGLDILKELVGSDS